MKFKSFSKNFNKNSLRNVYSKAYNQNKDQTLLVNDAKYKLVNNNNLVNMDNSRYNILKERNYSVYKRRDYNVRINPVFKIYEDKKYKINKSIRPSRYKLNEIVKNTNLYKKIYNQSLPNNENKKIVQKLSKKVVKTSINCLRKKNAKLKLSTNNKTFCMFFCRFGRCAKVETCPYKHDLSKVAVCKGFLKGKCEVKGCLLSHKIEPEKMPVCSFFLKGICNIDSCPYRHVNVNSNAEICKDFLKGFCSEGEQCKLLHMYIQENNENKSNCKDLKNKKTNEIKFDNKNDFKEIDNDIIDFSEKISLNDNSDIQIEKINNLLEKSCNIDNNDNYLDFIPLVKCEDDSDEELKDKNSVVLNTNFVKNVNQSKKNIKDMPTYEYDSDDSWFEDKSEKNSNFIQYIPSFLLN